MAEQVARLETFLEQLNTRFELIIEAMQSYGARLDRLNEEMFNQFAEVGKQIRFLCDRVAEDRESLNALRSELSAEMIRLGEALGATRVEFRQDMASLKQVQAEISTSNHLLRQEFAAGRLEVNHGLETNLLSMQTSLSEMAAKTSAADGSGRRPLSAVSSASADELRSELKLANKAIASLSKKFERFDDRVTVQVKDQDQRLRKIEKTRARG